MATKRTRFSGKRKRGRRPDPNNVLRRELNKQIRSVNKRLERLNRHGYKGQYGAKTLFNRLDVIDGLTTKGRTKLKLIKPKRVLSVGDVRELQKAIKNFKSSKISTIKGIKEAERRTKEHIRERITELDIDTGLPVSEPSKKDIEAIYNLMENKDFQRLKELDYLSSDEIINVLYNGKEMNKTPDELVNDLSDYVYDIEDEEVKNALKRVYKNYIKNV